MKKRKGLRPVSAKRAAKNKAVAPLGEPCTWLALCRDCHDAAGDYSEWPITRQLAAKLLADPGRFDLRRFNEIRGRAPGAITLSYLVAADAYISPIRILFGGAGRGVLSNCYGGDCLGGGVSFINTNWRVLKWDYLTYLVRANSLRHRTYNQAGK